jgi:hypothetical protein
LALKLFLAGFKRESIKLCRFWQDYSFSLPILCKWPLQSVQETSSRKETVIRMDHWPPLRDFQDEFMLISMITSEATKNTVFIVYASFISMKHFSILSPHDLNISSLTVGTPNTDSANLSRSCLNLSLPFLLYRNQVLMWELCFSQ